MNLKFPAYLIAVASLFALAILSTHLVKAQSPALPKHEDVVPPVPRPLIPPGSDPLLLLQSLDAEQRDDASIFLLRNYEDTQDKVQAVAEASLRRSAQKKANNANGLANPFGNEDDRVTETAIGLLGEFRSTRSISFLVDHLPFELGTTPVSTDLR